MDRTSSRYFLFDEKMKLQGWENTKEGDCYSLVEKSELRKFAFSGIQIINPKVIDMTVLDGKFPIKDLYLELISGISILGYNHTDTLWFDLGKYDELKDIENVLKGRNVI